MSWPAPRTPSPPLPAAGGAPSSCTRPIRPSCARPSTGAKVYSDYLQEFLDTVPGARTKELLVRDEDVQVLHGFETPEQANAYLSSELFTTKVVPGLTPLFKAEPDIRVYTVA